MPEFMPGLELARLFYQEAVRPILQDDFPGLIHSAALLGSGSEVLGFDTAMSADHDWGPRVFIFLNDTDHAQFSGRLQQTLGHKLPFTFRGYPTHFEDHPDGGLPVQTVVRPINHRVYIVTPSEFIRRYIGIEPDQELTLIDWLTIPEQNLCTLTAGAVYHDGLNLLEPLRRRLAYYPHDLWLYLLSAQWKRIGEEEPFVGRAGIVDDEIGSAVIAARLVRDIMRLCLLMAKQYAPYSKWFGVAFRQLESAAPLAPVLQAVLSATNWQQRQQRLAAAYEIIAAGHNDLGITAPVSTQVSYFYDRPFLVIDGSAIAQSIWDTIQDEAVRALPYGVGKVDQFVDSTDVLSYTDRYRQLAALYNQ